MASPSELYTIEAARKHEAAAQEHQAAFWRAEADNLRLEQEAERIKQEVAALEQEVSSTKTSAAELSDAFNEMIRLFQRENKKAELADKTIMAIRRALQIGTFSGLLTEPPPDDKRVTEADKLITVYMETRVKAIGEENASYL